MAQLRAFTRTFFRVAERLLPSEWLERHIYLPQGKQETKPGQVSFKDRPWMRELIDSVDDPSLTDIVLVAPTRLGKTFILRMIFAYSIAADPAPVMWVDPTDPKARDISKKELQPLVEANAVLRDRKPSNRHNYNDTVMLFPAAAFTMVGGNSDAQVAGDTVKRVLGNEVDKWRQATEKEAGIAELVRHRTESFDEERKHYWSSTPTLEEMPIWQFYSRGDQRKWQCPCQRCDTLQPLIWENVVWNPGARISEHKWDLKKVRDSARYSCKNVDCTAHDPTGENGTGWNDAERVAAVQDERAFWQPTAEAAAQPGWRSYQINGLYGPLKVNRVGELAVDFLSARNTGFYTDRQDFWNSRMGEPWRDQVSSVTTEKFAKREATPFGSYLRGEAPKGWKPDLVIIGFDVQTNRLPFVVAGLDWSGNAFTIDHGDAPSWEDLDQVQEDYRTLAPKSYVIGDINFEDRRAETLEQIFKRKKRGWFAAEGFELASELVKLEEANVYVGGKLQKQKHTAPKLVISLYQFKVELEKRFSGEIPNWFSYQLEIAATPQDVEEQVEYYKQLLDERRVPRKRKIAGKPPFEFRSKNKNNHDFDCWVYILALFWVLQKTQSTKARKRSKARKALAVSMG